MSELIKKFKGGSEVPYKWYIFYGVTEAASIAALKTIEKKAIENNWIDKLYGYLLPLETNLTHKKGLPVLTQKNRFSNYVYINVDLTPEIHFKLRELKVKILGNGKTFISEEEINKILNICFESTFNPVTKYNFKINDVVEIIETNFEGKIGIISEIDNTKNSAKVLIKIFGKETPINLSLTKLLKKEVPYDNY